EEERPSDLMALFFGRGRQPKKVPAEAGLNRFIWDLRYPDAKRVPGGFLWAGSTRGPVAVPGQYQVRLRVGDRTFTQPFEIRKDPRVKASIEDLRAQFDLLIKIRDRLSEAHQAVNTIRDVRKQIDDLVKRLKGHPQQKTIAEAAKALKEKLGAVEREIIQVKVKAPQDTLNYPIKLNNKLASLADAVASADARPTKQAYEVFGELSARLDDQLARLKEILRKDIPAFNRQVKAQKIPAIILKPAK
ncbi:MAG: glycosyl hydrolase, partial [Acidobacteria bacterium]